jgi:hypothetical protein
LNPTQKSIINHEIGLDRRLREMTDKEEFVVIDFALPTPTDMVIKRDGIDTMCFGSHIRSIYQFQCDEGGRNISSVYSKFDKVFKDTVTGTIFAVFKKPYLMSLIPIRPGVLELIISGAISRWNGVTQQTLERDKALHEGSTKLDIEAYVKLCGKSSSDIVSEAKDALSKAAEEIGNLQRELAEKMKIYTRYMTVITSFDEDKYRTEMMERVRKNIQDAMTIKYIKSIFTDEGIIHVYTKNIYAVDPRSKIKHDIGTFHIQLNMLSSEYDPDNSIVIKNTKHNITSPFGAQPMEAPHIFNGGHMCHGNLITAVTQHYAERDLYGLLVDVISFIESPNIDDPAGELVDHFPEAKDTEIKEDEFDKELEQSLNSMRRNSAA